MTKALFSHIASKLTNSIADMKELIHLTLLCPTLLPKCLPSHYFNCVSSKENIHKLHSDLVRIGSIIEIKGDLNFCGCFWLLLFQAVQVENVVPSQSNDGTFCGFAQWQS